MLKQAVHNYDSVSSFLDAFNRDAYQGSRDWMGNMTAQDALTCAVTGYDKAVAGAESLIAKLEGSLELPQGLGFETVHSPFGGRVSMSDWLTGSPTPMRRRIKRQSDVSPVRIFVDTFVSAGIEASTLKRRGEAIIALVLLAQRIRPVDLVAVGSSTFEGHDGYRYFAVKLESRPISLSQVGFVLGHPAFFRALGNGYFTFMNPKAPSVPCLLVSREENRAHLGLTDGDVFVEKARYGDTLVDNPDVWIQTQIERIKGDIN